MLSDVQQTIIQSSVFSRERYLEAGSIWGALPKREDTHLFFVMGIRGQACAVACGGVWTTADDRSGRRLTNKSGPTSRSLWRPNAGMYANVLVRHLMEA